MNPYPDETAEEYARRTSAYSYENMRTIRGAEHIRLHPGMYIGNTQSMGLHQMLFGVIGHPLPNTNAIPRRISVRLHFDDSLTISDNHRQLRFDHAATLTAAMEGTFGPNGSHWDEELLNYEITNALSEWL